MNDPNRFTWDDVRQIADQLELEAHLAGMEARDRWEKLRPRLAALKQTIEHEGAQAGKALGEQLTAIGKALRALLDQVRDDTTPKEGKPS